MILSSLLVVSFVGLLVCYPVGFPLHQREELYSLINEKSETEMTASVQENKLKHKRLQMNAF